MRVTNKMLSNNFLRDMNVNLQNLKTLQEQMTSGKEIRRPSDNPFKVARSMQLHTQINSNKQYNENIKDTINWLDVTDTSLDQMGEVFKRVKELLVSAGNGGYGENELAAIKDEINEKVSEFSQILNTNFDGKYIFGGTRATTKPTMIQGGSSFSGAVETNSLDFSGEESLVESDGKLKEDINFELQFDVDRNGTISATEKETITLSKGTKISNIQDLANKLNNKIDTSSKTWLKDKVRIDVSNNRLKVVNENDNGNLNKFIVKSKELLIDGEATSINEPSSKVINVSTLGSLSGDLDIELGFNVNTKKITLHNTENIKNLSDLAGKINDEINTSSEDWLRGKVKVVTDLANNNLKFVNISDSATTFKVKADKLGIKQESDITYSPNNSQNTRIMYNKKGDGELVDGNELNQIGEKLKVEISQGVIIDYNVTARDVMEYNGKDLRNVLNDIVNHLDYKKEDGVTEDKDSVKKLINDDLVNIEDALKNILKIRSEVGAKQNSMDSAKSKNEDQNFNMKEILSKTEDIDITEKTMEFATAQTVYISSLTTSAKVLQPTLIDYIR
ncbi:flagellar hook-associated protein FlgL [Haloimpatiens sp. FM7315]|uniref:flagellar hook-associated protein FlgL n=1 Tax=Haloimpatiens sp. FM7315 TaxID=3298609 RepID=UPI0035A31C9A